MLLSTQVTHSSFASNAEDESSTAGYLAYTVNADGNEYFFRARTVPEGILDEATVDEDRKAFVVKLLPSNTNGTIAIELRRDIIDSKDQDNNDIDFQATVDGESVGLLELGANEEFRVAEVTFPANATEVAFIGTQVIPEFGGFLYLVILVSLGAVIGWRLVGYRMGSFRYSF
jgi:hypothetical protein